MSIQTLNRLAARVAGKVPLRTVLIVPFVLQIVGTVGLVGYLSFRSGQQAVADLANQLMQAKGNRIVQNLEYYFKTPKTLVREHQVAIKLGILNWQNPSLIEAYFVEQLNIYTDVNGLMITTQSKDFLAVGHPQPERLVIRERNPKTGALENYASDLQGNRLYLQDTLPNYDPHADPPANPWYGAAKANKDGFWQPVVSLVRGKDYPILMMAYFLRFADSQGELQGVLSASVHLDRVGEFLHRLQIGKAGQAFIIDEKGLLIATSTTEVPFRRDLSIKPKETLTPETLRLAAQDSQNSVTRTAVAWSLNPNSHPRGFRLHNQQYFGRVIPFKLDNQISWTIVVVVPESDFMAQIQANTRYTALLCGLALLGAIGSSIWTSKRITRSLFRLTQATQSVAAGTLDTPLPATRIAEVESLTVSFRQMVMELQEANQLRQNYAQDLERQVANKTSALTEAQRIAKVGSWEFDLATQEVIWSEELYRIYEAEEQAPIPRPDLTIQQIHPDDQERFQREVVEAAIAHQPFDTDLRIITHKGNIRYIQAKGQPIYNAQGEVVKLAGIVADISARRAAELELQAQEQKLSSIAANIPGGIYRAVYSAQGNLLSLYMSDSYRQLLGYDPNELLQHPEGLNHVLNMIHPNDQPKFFQALQVAEKALEPSRLEYRLMTASGEAKWIVDNARFSRGEQGELIVDGVDIDISERKQAEIALQQSETRFQQLAATAPGVIYSVVEYPNGAVRYDYLSPAFEEIHEISVAQAYQDATIPFNQMHPDDRASYQQAVAQALETMQPFRHEWRIITPSGKLKWIQAHSRPEWRDNKELVWHGIVIDISDRKRAEEALQQSESRFQRLADSNIVGIILTTPTGEIREANDAFLQMVGYDRTDLLRGNLRWDTITSPDYNEVDAAAVAHLLTHGWVQPFEKEYTRKDGSRVAVLVAGARIEGNRKQVISVILDISDRKLAEEKLRQSEQRYLAIIQDQTELIVRFLPDGTLSFVNEAYCRYFGITPDQIIGHPYEPIIFEEDRAYVDQLVKSITVENSVVTIENRVIVAGEVRWTQWINRALFDKWGSLIEIQAVGRDISDKKLADTELQQALLSAEAANRAKSAFLATMSHELRTPLNGILGYAQILQRDKNTTPKQKEGVDIIYQCGTHLLTLINDILDLSKIEADKLELYPEDFNFSSFLTGLTEIFRLKALQKSIIFTYLPLSELPTMIHADQKRLRQVLMNLLSNAVKFTDAGSVTFKVEILENGKVTPSSSSIQNPTPLDQRGNKIQNQLIRFQIEDTGIGITPEQLEKIFLPFEQVGDTSRRAEGTGLGLAITQKIIAQMGGKIFVESTPKVGSKFWFNLDFPVVSMPMKSIISKSNNTIIGYSGKTIKILIVDDRWKNRAVLTNILEPIGFELEEAVDGQEGLEKALEFQPDFILIDLVMPVMDGYEMTRRIRQFPALQNTIIIAVSANAFEVDRLRSLDAGCNDFLPKPIQAEDLLEKIKIYLNLSWIYNRQEAIKDVASPQPQSSTLSEMNIPSKEELLALHEAANIGHIQGVEREASRLQQLSPDYTPFVTKILKLADEFEYEEIANLIEYYLSEDLE